MDKKSRVKCGIYKLNKLKKSFYINSNDIDLRMINGHSVTTVYRVLAWHKMIEQASLCLKYINSKKGKYGFVYIQGIEFKRVIIYKDGHVSLSEFSTLINTDDIGYFSDGEPDLQLLNDMIECEETKVIFDMSGNMNIGIKNTECNKNEITDMLVNLPTKTITTIPKEKIIGDMIRGAASSELMGAYYDIKSCKKNYVDELDQFENNEYINNICLQKNMIIDEIKNIFEIDNAKMSYADAVRSNLK